MKLYPKISISESARSDFQALYDFLNATLSYRGALMYMDAMLKEVNSLTAYADSFRRSRYMDIPANEKRYRHRNVIFSADHSWREEEKYE